MIIVFGSINIDLIMQVKRFPQPGETVLTGAYEWMPGGKGMNQALAACRAGAKVAMVGCVGDDGFGTRAFADQPAIAKARLGAVMDLTGSYGTHVSNGTKGRPEGRGGGAG